MTEIVHVDVKSKDLISTITKRIRGCRCVIDVLAAIRSAFHLL